MSAYPGKSTDIVAILADGRIIAYAVSAASVIPPAGGTIHVQITFPDLKHVEYVVEMEMNLNPLVAAQMSDKDISGNVVGVTVYAASAGTTVVIDALAIGPP